MVLARVRCHVCRTVLSWPTAGVPLCQRKRCRVELERRRVVAAVFVAAAPVEWVSLREIASFAGWSESSTSGVLTGLERHGWVASRQVGSQRADWRRCWRGLREYRLTGQGVPGVRALVDTAGAA